MIDASREQFDELANKYFLDLKKIRQHNGGSHNLNHPLSQEENVIKEILINYIYIYILESLESILYV
jgi:hypothetical protein